MILINSAGYVVPELQVEYGKIPPCMLPLGNRRLFQYQLEVVSNSSIANERVLISLPERFILSEADKKLLCDRKVEVYRVPENFCLGESVLYVLNCAGISGDRLYMLHGDTYVKHFPERLDVLGVSKTVDDYGWQLEEIDSEHELIWCGFFSFSDTRNLVMCLAHERGDFVTAIKSYFDKKKSQLYQFEDWYDLGHLNTYFKSRERITTQRSFNSMLIGNGVVKKSGAPAIKIKAEAEWFEKLPSNLRKYTPQLISYEQADENVAYTLEYLTLPPLNEVYVYGENPSFYWRTIFSTTAELMAELRRQKPEKQNALNDIQKDFEDLVKEKTLKRLKVFGESGVADPQKGYSYQGETLGSLYEIASHCAEMTMRTNSVPSVLHGDLCFSNMLFDSRADSIKVIDPRGLNERGDITLFGDQRYDLAKLAHSVLGMYDYIIAGRYRLEDFGGCGMAINFDATKSVLDIQEVFLKTSFIPSLLTCEIKPLVVILFLSMLPLHADRPDRQRAMLANALRLYSELEVEAK